MICSEYKIKGFPAKFDGRYGVITKILGNNQYLVATRDVGKLNKLVEVIEYVGKCEIKNYEHEYIKSELLLAELTTVTLDEPITLQSEWENFVSYYGKLNWHNRMYFTIDQFTPQFQKLLNQISNEIKLPYLDITLQIHDVRLYDIPIELNVPHRDGYRRTNITIPIYAEPEEKIKWHSIPSDIILQSSTYSLKHPSMVNVGDTHSVSLVPGARRILIQLSYRETTDQIYNSNPNIFNIYK